MIRVLVAARSGLVRAALETAVRTSQTLEFTGAIDPLRLATGGLSATESTGDVMLMEIAEATEVDWRLLTQLGMPVLLLVDPADSGLLSSALRAGIRGVISWDATPQEIEGAVQAVNAGLVVTMPGSLTDLLPEAQTFAEALAEPLSERELEVLDLLAEGLSNKLLAHRLSISEHTVKTHVASIFAKLGASSRTEAVSQAIRRGLIML